MSKHLHKFRRVNIGKDGKQYFVMRCTKPECRYYVAMNTKLSAPLLKDTLAECNRCGDRFILDKRALRMTEPCCEDCVKKKVDPKVKEAENFFQDLEKGLLES